MIVAAGLAMCACAGPAGRGAQRRPVHPADVALTPAGWSPVGLGPVQVSVPSGWVVEDPEWSCSGTAGGMVFIDQAPRPGSPHMACPLPANVVAIWEHPGPQAHLADGRDTAVNGIPARVGTVDVDGRAMSAVEALGAAVEASGPLAHAVLRTLTYSPSSVVLASWTAPIPHGWHTMTFGGISFAVPAAWAVEKHDWWGGCPGNIQADTVVLSTASVVSTPGCPALFTTAGALAARPGMVVGAGPKVDAAPPGAHCFRRSGLRFCVAPPPSPTGGFVPGRELGLLTAQVTVPGQQFVDQVELGLSGSGGTAKAILDSMRPSG